ncbi:MAG: DUF937 domain-containing protein [Verrucomicrobiaceae bacterium]|nr:DUF937 domain-containing protein [Verrucomicrobiaceae bacterium]
MGLFDTLAKNALGSMLGGSSKQDPAAMLSGLLSEAGGIEGLMGQFQSAGFGSQFASWVSTGENQPLSEDQMHSAIGAEALQGLASKLGMNTGTVLPLLAQFLPQVIDKLTPQGQIADNHPSSGQLQSVLTSVISSSLGGLFGGRK